MENQKESEKDIDFQSEPPDCSITKAKTVKPPKKIQRTIFASLKLQNPSNQNQSSQNKQTPQLQTVKPPAAKTKLNPKQAASSTTKPTRTVTKETVEKWKDELAVHRLADWLDYESNIKGQVESLKCKVCTQFRKDKDSRILVICLLLAQRILKSLLLKIMPLKVNTT